MADTPRVRILDDRVMAQQVGRAWLVLASRHPQARTVHAAVLEGDRDEPNYSAGTGDDDLLDVPPTG